MKSMLPYHNKAEVRGGPQVSFEEVQVLKDRLRPATIISMILVFTYILFVFE